MTRVTALVYHANNATTDHGLKIGKVSMGFARVAGFCFPAAGYITESLRLILSLPHGTRHILRRVNWQLVWGINQGSSSCCVSCVFSNPLCYRSVFHRSSIQSCTPKLSGRGGRKADSSSPHPLRVPARTGSLKSCARVNG